MTGRAARQVLRRKWMHPVLASLAQQMDPSRAPQRTLRPLLLVAHQDDETIGASALLGRVPGCTVVYLTDGAPKDPRLRSPLAGTSRQHYAQLREEEASAALARVGIPGSRIVFLGGTDQEAIYEWRSLLESFIEILQALRPEILITHPYEGGHPDHDAAALIGRLAVLQMKGAMPSLLEMTSYHTRRGQLVLSEFHPDCRGDEGDVFTIRLTPEEQDRKKGMLSCYRSQAEVLSVVPLELERTRMAPSYDFTRPPHQGSLWYELLGWPTTGARWRELAAQALARAGEPT
jgi:N-acetylglucosamine malate deacetylase 2